MTEFEANNDVDVIACKYAKNVALMAFSYVKNIADAEDIMQEVYLAMYEKKPSFESEEHLKAWLIRVAINKSKNHLKSFWHKKRETLHENFEACTEEENYVMEAMFSLKEKYRVPMHLHYYEGYSLEEIGKILNANPSTVGTWLARGKEELRKVLGGIDI